MEVESQWAPQACIIIAMFYICLHRYQLNKIVVDTEAGPYRNRTVLFLGSSRGTILKFLIMPNQDNTVTSSNIFLEELEGFNPDK